MKNSFFKNFLSLSFSQVINFLAPLITAPYVIRIVGIKNYGSISIALSIVTFFMLFADYGFNLTATRDVSLNRNDKEELSKVFYRITYAKVLILGLVLMIYLILIDYSPYFENNKHLFLLSSTIIIGNAFLPTWFFQGMENMRMITILTLFTRASSVFLTFLLIRDEADYILINLITGLTTITGAIWGTGYLIIRYKITFMITPWVKIKKEFRNGLLPLITNLSNVSYTFSNILILDLVTGDKSLVGSYSIAEKVLVMFKQVLIVYSQVVYPKFCHLASTGFKNILDFLRSNYKCFLIIVTLGSIVLFLSSPLIISIFVGKADKNATLALRLMSFIPVIITLNIPSYQILLAYNFRRSYTLIYFLAGIIGPSLCYLLSSRFSYRGTIYSIAIVELFISIGLYWILRSRHLQKIYKLDSINSKTK
jgi:PST family polysaccharide transporter